MSDTEDRFVTEWKETGEYLVVADGGANDGEIKAGPFEHATHAVKEKNRLNRETGFPVQFRVQPEVEAVA